MQRTIAAPQRFSLISLCSLGKFYRHLQSPSKFRKVGLFKTLTRHNFFRLDSNQKSLLEERLLTINTLANLPNNLLLMCLLMVAELGLEPRYSQLMRLASYHYSIPQYYWLFIKLHLTQTNSNSFEKTFELLHQISIFYFVYIL